MNDPTPTVPPFGVVLTTLPDEAGAEALARHNHRTTPGR